MLSVILTILKVIGIILAVLIGLVLLIVLLVGFVPVRYKSSALYPYEGELDEEAKSKRKRDILKSKVRSGENDGETSTGEDKKSLKLKADATVSWLLHIVHVSFKMDDTGIRLCARLFGIFKVYSNDPEKARKKEEKAKKKEAKRKAKEEKKKKKNNKEEYKEEFTEDKTEAAAKEKAVETEETVTDDKTANRDEDKSFDQTETDSQKDDGLGSGEKENETKTEDSSEDGEENDVSDDAETKEKKGIVTKLKNLYNKFDGIRKKVVYVKDMAENERVKRGIGYGKKKLLLIIKRILPKKLKGYVAFGMDDPATTGYITGTACLFYGLWAGHFTLEPDFEQKRLEADVNLKGRIVLAMLVIPAFKIWFNKDIKYIRRKVNKLKKM